ncbi:helix-turn-helix domain-containing protein [Caulobacter sp. 17J80-11]|uniref:helix-turn-helix domain-containing protein n=1 Tax=Caulobacter sp. 17J80-11 TaxID=2763502 RepID=UPI001653C36B|nr:helix-turn-helix domain-containing protein [Caulobacter sp. 17J80-11]MBC6982467.1 helix-turn-helix domain-containing protein [Caulobacter sp. 17J80-11]
MPRPSDYREHYGAVAEAALAEGASLSEAAAGLCVGARTLRRWAAAFPAFGAALARGLAEGARRRAQYRDGCAGRVEALLAEGLSGREVAAELGVSPATLADWRAAHADFAQAWARGTAQARRRGISGGTRYRPEFCEIATACLAKGWSQTVLADELGVSRRTLASWIERHGAFAEAVERGRIKGARLWESRLEAVAAAGSVQAVIFALKRLDPERWDAERAPSTAFGGPPPPKGEERATRIETVFVEPKPALPSPLAGEGGARREATGG